MTMLWTPPAPPAGRPPVRPPLWSMRRTALAVVAAVTVGALTAVGVSYADTGSSTGPAGGFGGRGFRGSGFPGTGGPFGGSSGPFGGLPGGAVPQFGQLGG